jgi:hypothetical protein
MAYRRDDVEWDRRRRNGVGAVADLETLDVLMDLPAGMPVPVHSLHPADHRLLRQLSGGVVRCQGGMVVRDLVPALQPLLAIVRAREWQRGAEVASRFAVYCPRLVVLPESPHDLDVVLSEASLYGIGVAAGGAGSPQILIEPAPMVDWQPTSAGWTFSEQIYAQVRDHQR